MYTAVCTPLISVLSSSLFPWATFSMQTEFNPYFPDMFNVFIKGRSIWRYSKKTNSIQSILYPPGNFFHLMLTGNIVSHFILLKTEFTSWCSVSRKAVVRERESGKRIELPGPGLAKRLNSSRLISIPIPTVIIFVVVIPVTAGLVSNFAWSYNVQNVPD